MHFFVTCGAMQRAGACCSLLCTVRTLKVKKGIRWEPLEKGLGGKGSE